MARQFILPIARELVVDLFAGGGGASTGIEQAMGRHVDIAVNHDPEAVSLHEANHPQTRHYVSDVFEVDPQAVCGDLPVGLLWASPDCTFHSKARGGKPHRDRNKARRRRGLAGVVVRWAAAVRPRVIALENVEEFQHWGPLLADGTPCPERKGASFKRWVAQLRNLGYAVEWRELRACDYGAPTIRKRLFLIARCDGQPIKWPEPTHTDPKHAKERRLPAWRTAAVCIDWSLPCPSIFERERTLADSTLRRIAHGVMRYVVNAAKPFIVPVTHVQATPRVHDIAEPLRTITTAKRGEFTVVAAFLAKHYGGVVGHGVDQPTGTVTTTDHHSVVAANLIHAGHGEGSGKTKRRSHGSISAESPLNTVTASGGTAALVTSHLAKLRGTSNSASAADPLATVSAGGTHHAEVRALLVKYYGTGDGQELSDPLHTVTTRDRFALVNVRGEVYAIADIGMRMLQPRELYRAQGFPEEYVIDRGADGRAFSKAAQVRMCGNSVCPPVARAIVAANFIELEARRAA